MYRRRAAFIQIVAPIAVVAGCVEPSARVDLQHGPDSPWRTVAAERVVLHGPLIQPTTLDDDPIPDGLNVVLQALDHQGEPTKIAGLLTFELYGHRRASFDPKGPLLQTWQLPLTRHADQQAYWDPASLMYELPLVVDANRLSPQTTYVLVARYTNPWGEHLQDEATLEFRGLPARIKEAVGGTEP